jgi:predicted GIY-YIG superfamily endonuclease
MDLEVKWHQPIPLVDGDDENLIYTVNGLEEWEGYPAVYMFCRRYGKNVVPLYIGRTANVAARIKQHLNATKMMRAIEKSQNGEKVLIVGELITKTGQKIDKSLRIIENALIEHALAEGYELVNKSGTKTPVHFISYFGFKEAKDFSGAGMYAKISRTNRKAPK